MMPTTTRGGGGVTRGRGSSLAGPGAATRGDEAVMHGRGSSLLVARRTGLVASLGACVRVCCEGEGNLSAWY